MFITQTTSTQLRTIHEIIRNSDFAHCILISTISLDVVLLEINEGKDVSDVITAGRGPAEATKQLEAMLIEWIGKKVCLKLSKKVVYVYILLHSMTEY